LILSVSISFFTQERSFEIKQTEAYLCVF